MKQLYAGIDLGGTNISAALADADGNIASFAKKPTGSHEGPSGVLNRIASLINELSEQNGARPAALGIGVPGLADVKNGVTKFLPNMPTKWRDVDVRGALEPKIGCPVHLLNDARAATLGELVFGRGKGASTMIFFGLGTGVGGGVVVDGRLRLGLLGAAGELGHQTILPDGPLCGCGNRGCLETLASGPAISAEGVRLFLQGNAPRLYDLCAGDVADVTPATMAQAAAEGDAPVQQAIERAAGWLGIGVENLITALHPELVTIGGGVAEMGDRLLEPLREAVKRRVGMLPADTVKIEKSMLGDRAGLFGAVALAVKGGVE